MRRQIHVVDSHTGGEPTRVVVSGGPDLGDGPLVRRAERLEREFAGFRSGLVGEPRGTEALVAAVLGPPETPSSRAGVVYFDRAGVLGMCGHGTIGLVATLAHEGRLAPGPATLDTPVGPVRTELHADGSVSVENVAAHRTVVDRSVRLDAETTVVGDVVWGGNWFFVVDPSPIPLVAARIPELLAFTRRVRDALARDGIRGEDGAPISHVFLNAPGTSGASGRDFVLCPSDTYDRSPCGTGTSALLAVLQARGKLGAGEPWVEESITGSRFVATFAMDGTRVRPTIRGSAFVTGVTDLEFDDADPFREGIRL
jgi:4-hydroxyproline epimerase